MGIFNFYQMILSHTLNRVSNKSLIKNSNVIRDMFFMNYVRASYMYQELIAIFYLVKIKMSTDIFGSETCIKILLVLSILTISSVNGQLLS